MTTLSDCDDITPFDVTYLRFSLHIDEKIYHKSQGIRTLRGTRHSRRVPSAIGQCAEPRRGSARRMPRKIPLRNIPSRQIRKMRNSHQSDLSYHTQIFVPIDASKVKPTSCINCTDRYINNWIYFLPIACVPASTVLQPLVIFT